jgi:hypothetical protein
VAVVNDPVHPVSFASLQTAVDNWTKKLAALAPCSGVSFTTGVGSGQTIKISSGATPIDPLRPNRIIRGFTDSANAAYLDGRLYSVPVIINTAVTDPTAVTEVIAHEMGHTLALVDCVQCGLHTTVMEVGDMVAP